MNAFLAGVRFQFWSLRHSVDELQTFVITPLFTIIFGGIVTSSGRSDLLPSAVLGAVLMGMWTLCLQAGGNIIEHERWGGTFEALESTPAQLRQVVIGRVTTIIGVALLTVPEAWLVALGVFHKPIAVSQPGPFVVALLLTVLGLHATAVMFAALFVLARNALIFQNFLAYPIYLLGGLLVPVSVMPDWVQPLTRVIYLSWGSDLLRAALRPEPIEGTGGKLLGLAVTVAVIVAIGQLLFGAVLKRARVHGSLSLV